MNMINGAVSMIKTMVASVSMNGKALSVIAWPGRIPVPLRLSAAGADGVELRGELLVVAGGSGGAQRSVTPELYLRELRDLSVGDAEAVRAFVGVYGVPQVTSRDQAVDDSSMLAGLLHEGSAFKHEGRIDRAALAKIAEPLVRRVRGGAVVGSLTSVQLAVDWLYDLTTIAVEHEWGRLASGPSEWRSGWIERPVDRRTSLRLLSGGLSAALRPFHARVLLREDTDDATPRFGRVGVYEIAALQLFDDIAAGIEFRPCANQSCLGTSWPSKPPKARIGGAGVGRVFVRQVGGGARERYKTEGVRFCSRACARAELQREYRAGKGRS